MAESLALEHLRKDPVLAPYLADAQPLHWPLYTDVYESLLRSIIFQQLNGKAAETIHQRFLNLFPDKLPDPEQILELDTAQLRSVGLSGQKTQYIQHVASFAMANKRLQLDWDDMSDDEILKCLTQIKGVGRWTVEMILIFTLRRPDIFPLDDYGIQQAVKKVYKIDSQGKELKKFMQNTAENWKPYRSYATRYLWNFL
jgi:DNA-3-methyladenine glycosylase II